VVGISFGDLRTVPVRDLTIRFAFGAAISTAASVIGLAAGPRFGGIFLAFPAILPATPTLIEKEESKRKAKDDDIGSILGAAALVAFAVTAWRLVPADGSPVGIARPGSPGWRRRSASTCG